MLRVEAGPEGIKEMRYLTTSVAVLAMVSAAVMTPATSWAQDGAGLRDALSEAQAGDNSALREAIAPDGEAPSLAAFPADEAPVLLEPEELDALVAPVALYPDALLAQVLVAATHPLQVAKADQLIAASAEMPEDELTDALARQDFDPSVLVLLAGFPTVVSRMAEDLDWTERLGLAMLSQDEDVLEAVQRMRAEAEAVGNLESNEAQIVEEDAGEIYIRPADPEVVYVPSYDPVTTYTTPYTPAYTTPYAGAMPYGASSSSLNPLHNPLVAGALAFGAALLVQELFGDDDDDDDTRTTAGTTTGSARGRSPGATASSIRVPRLAMPAWGTPGRGARSGTATGTTARAAGAPRPHETCGGRR